MGLASLKIKTEMAGSLNGRWMRRAEAKERANRGRREIDKLETYDWSLPLGNWSYDRDDRLP